VCFRIAWISFSNPEDGSGNILRNVASNIYYTVRKFPKIPSYLRQQVWKYALEVELEKSFYTQPKNSVAFAGCNWSLWKSWETGGGGAPVYLQQRVIRLTAQLLSQTFSAPINMHRVTTCAQKDRCTGLRGKRTVLIFNGLTKIYSAVLALLHFSEATKPLSTYLQR